MFDQKNEISLVDVAQSFALHNGVTVDLHWWGESEIDATIIRSLIHLQAFLYD